MLYLRKAGNGMTTASGWLKRVKRARWRWRYRAVLARWERALGRVSQDDWRRASEHVTGGAEMAAELRPTAWWLIVSEYVVQVYSDADAAAQACLTAHGWPAFP